MPSCAYCGNANATDREHVIPKCLYPPSRSTSRVQRLTVPACSHCNNSWSSDEAHFRNVLMLAGEPNEAVREIWEGSVRRSFAQIDGKTRLAELVQQMVPVKVDGTDRHMVYPARDPRVMRVVRKVVRGLCHHHQVMSPVADQRVRADVMKFVIPQEFLDQMTVEHREKDIATYRYSVLNELDINSVWLISFYERTEFVGLVSMSQDRFFPNSQSA